MNPKFGMKKALEIMGLTKRYGRRTALDGLDISVPAGAVFGLIGSNGAGKTTTMSICAGLLRPDRGRVDVLESGPFRPETHAGRLSLLPQDAQLPPLERVVNLLEYYGRLQGIAARHLDREVEHILRATHLWERRRSTVRELSHGMQRRLNIAQALLGSPECVLLDEPLSGLDPLEQRRMRDLIRNKPAAQTVIISSHQLGDLETLCTHAAFMENGRCLRQDTLDTLTRRHTTLTYLLAAAAPPPAIHGLADVLAPLSARCTLHGDRLQVVFEANTGVEHINRTVIPWLWRQSAGLLEIRRGDGLEIEYLRLAQPQNP